MSWTETTDSNSDPMGRVGEKTDDATNTNATNTNTSTTSTANTNTTATATTNKTTKNNKKTESTTTNQDNSNNNDSQYNTNNGTDETAGEQVSKGTKRGKAKLERGGGSSNDNEVYDANNSTTVEWDDEIDVDELIDDAQEYDFNIQVEEELAAYVEDEMIDDESNGSASIDRSASENEPCAIEQNNKRQKACPGLKRRIVTVTQWDASARKQMIRQLGQRGVT